MDDQQVAGRDCRFVEDEFPLLSSASTLSLPSSAIVPADVSFAPVRAAEPVAPALPYTPAAVAPVLPAAPAPVRHQSVTPATSPRLDFSRAFAPLPSISPPESPGPLDCLDRLDPFSASLSEVGALMAALGDDLTANGDDFVLPSSDPHNHREAARDVDSERWRLGEEDEFCSLRDDYKVFHSVPRSSLPPGAKVLGCRLVYRRKKDENGKVTGYKVRLVAQGFSQRPGVDFRETFAPVAKFTSIRVLLALAARQGLLVEQADVDKAYLYGHLEENLYMRVPERIDLPELGNHVLRLDRTLYGLKQAGRVWNFRIHDSLVSLGYSRTRSDACVYVRRDGDAFHYLALYVDNLLILSKSAAEIQRVHRHPDGSIFLSQRAYLEDVLLRLGQSGIRTTLTPMIPNQQLVAAPANYVPDTAFRRRYMQAVGSLMYAILGTRPDLAYVVGVLGRHAARLNEAHWSAIVRVCQYLKGTLDYGIEYTPDTCTLTGFEAYSDSDWGACLDTARSTMGYSFLLGAGAVSWSSKIQLQVAASSTEAEYLGLSHASKEAVFLSQLLDELGFAFPLPVTLLGNNQGANAVSRDPQFHDRTRHLRLTKHFVREQVEQGVLRVEYIPTTSMVADAMTKSLPAPAFAAHRAALGVKLLRARGGVAASGISYKDAFIASSSIGTGRIAQSFGARGVEPQFPPGH
ncbi:hypothetical protein JCM11251_003665 [Rhodosporidiobolus azoricus]